MPSRSISNGGGPSGDQLPKPKRFKLRSRDFYSGSSITDATVERKTPAERDFWYFNAYGNLGVHEEMIKDQVRIKAYRDAITYHQSSILDKVVADIGCGTGILAIFCAFAGARRVYAVDASEIVGQAERVVEANDLSDTITVLRGRIEDVVIGEQVDVIVSDWMGYMLLYESMLGSVIKFRDRWLKHGGLMIPSHASLYMAPITNVDRYSDSIDFWRSVYGINMSPMLPHAKKCAFIKPSVETITIENVLAHSQLVKYVDCYKVTISELDFIKSDYNFKSNMRAQLHGFVFWFDVGFTSPGHVATTNASNLNLVLSTAPDKPLTHWQQTVIYLYSPVKVEKDEDISGHVSLAQSRANTRRMTICLFYSKGANSDSRLYTMGM